MSRCDAVSDVKIHLPHLKQGGSVELIAFVTIKWIDKSNAEEQVKRPI